MSREKIAGNSSGLRKLVMSAIPEVDPKTKPTQAEHPKNHNERVTEFEKTSNLVEGGEHECPEADLDCLQILEMSEKSIPIHLKCMLSQFKSDDLTQAELLFVLIYTMAIENGYVCDRAYAGLEMDEMEIPTICTMANKSRFTMKLRFLVNVGVNIKSKEELIVQLTGFLIGDVMIVTFIPDVATSESGTSVALSISRYILADWAKSKPLHERCMKIPELLCIIRNELLLPIRNKQLHSLQANIYPSLDALPLELYDKILQYLSPKQLRNLALVNHSLCDAVLCSMHTNRLKQELKKES